MPLIHCNPADLFVSARVTALRWDLVPWGLVLDVNAQTTEQESARLHRGWIVFEGVSDLFAPFNNSRLPMGFWVYSFTSEFKEGWAYSSFSAQVPTYDDEVEKFDDHGMKRFSVKSKGVTAVISDDSATGDEYRNLDHQTRQQLGSDDEFLQALR